jgi:hypothetical protein
MFSYRDCQPSFPLREKKKCENYPILLAHVRRYRCATWADLGVSLAEVGSIGVLLSLESVVLFLLFPFLLCCNQNRYSILLDPLLSFLFFFLLLLFV